MNNMTTGPGMLFYQLFNSVFGNNQRDNSDRATAGADAHFGVQKAWDYFLLKHSRNGFDGSGTRVHARVHYGNNVQNAFWDNSCGCLKLGDGGTTYGPLVSLDVVGHEFAHGVMRAEANLTYSGESGGLNEANSDIFGTMIEYYAAAPWDAGDYRIGEKPRRVNWGPIAPYPPRALRYMFDPAQDGQSPACWYSGIGSLNVHYSSGPANHMFYLLAEGGTSKCNGNVVAGIGRDAAAKIWYKAIRDNMVSGTNYAGARTACVSAAQSIYGAFSTQSNAVRAAFSAINVN
jgi:Zn-dependent metalloprotease